MSADAKTELVEFIVDRALTPVLKAKAGSRSDAERRKLDHVQAATRSEIERYRDYGSAKEVLVNFRRDLNSHAARKVHEELRSLDLPTLDDIREAFEAKAAELGVAGSD